jgi:ankyrin repeat protein
MEAAYHNQADAAALLLDRGFRINDLDASGQSALMHAALAGRAGVVKLLLARGACTHFRNVDGMSAAMCAAANGHIGGWGILWGLCV